MPLSKPTWVSRGPKPSFLLFVTVISLTLPTPLPTRSPFPHSPSLTLNELCTNPSEVPSMLNSLSYCNSVTLIKRCPDHCNQCPELSWHRHVTEETGDDSHPQPRVSLPAIRIFPAEAPDTMEQKQAIITTPRPSSQPTDARVMWLFYATQFGMICYAAIGNWYTQQNHQFCLVPPAAQGVCLLSVSIHTAETRDHFKSLAEQRYTQGLHSYAPPSLIDSFYCWININLFNHRFNHVITLLHTL